MWGCRGSDIEDWPFGRYCGKRYPFVCVFVWVCGAYGLGLSLCEERARLHDFGMWSQGLRLAGFRVQGLGFRGL